MRGEEIRGEEIYMRGEETKGRREKRKQSGDNRKQKRKGDETRQVGRRLYHSREERKRVETRGKERI